MECVQDAKAAVRWVRANAEEYGINSNKIGVCGASAGAHLAAMVATSSDQKHLEGEGGNADVSSEVQAGSRFWRPQHLQGEKLGQSTPAIGSFLIWFKTVSPYQYASAGDAPMKFIHGSADPLVSPEEAQDLYAKLKPSWRGM